MNLIILKTCCVTGHVPKEFPWDYDTESNNNQEYLENMAYQIYWLIRKENITHFISGGDIGVEMGFAEIVIGLRDNQFDDITLEIILPYINQHNNYNDLDKARYLNILAQANLVTHIPMQLCTQKHNEYIVDKADFVLAFWNGENKGGTFNTFSYSKKKGKQLNITYLKLL